MKFYVEMEAGEGCGLYHTQSNLKETHYLFYQTTEKR